MVTKKYQHNTPRSFIMSNCYSCNDTINTDSDLSVVANSMLLCWECALLEGYVDNDDMPDVELLDGPVLLDSGDNYDDSMDGDFDSGMASAGWGVDEDYGYYGE